MSNNTGDIERTFDFSYTISLLIIRKSFCSRERLLCCWRNYYRAVRINCLCVFYEAIIRYLSYIAYVVYWIISQICGFKYHAISGLAVSNVFGFYGIYHQCKRSSRGVLYAFWILLNNINQVVWLRVFIECIYRLPLCRNCGNYWLNFELDVMSGSIFCKWY